VKPEHTNTNEDTMLIYFTSGTSGEPKMVAHDHLYAIGHLTTVSTGTILTKRAYTSPWPTPDGARPYG
jgi:acyl-coenzyme A synthetase/AMP-(fatty) acid ligase